MDVNLTGQVTAILTQSPTIGAGVIGGLVTGIVTLIGVIITQKHSEKKDDQNRKSIVLQKKRQIYSELMGQKKTVVQTHISYHATNIHKVQLNYIHICQSICHITDPTLFQQYHEADKLSDDLIR